MSAHPPPSHPPHPSHPTHPTPSHSLTRDPFSLSFFHQEYPPNAFAVHHWAHTWTPGNDADANKNGVTRVELHTGKEIDGFDAIDHLDYEA